MNKILYGIMTLAVVVALASSYPATTTFAKDPQPESLQGFCLQAKVDAKLLGETLHGNVKQLCL